MVLFRTIDVVQTKRTFFTLRMERGSPFNYVCVCGRAFQGPGPLNKHGRACKSRRRRLVVSLTRARETDSTNSALTEIGNCLDTPAAVADSRVHEDVPVRFSACVLS